MALGYAIAKSEFLAGWLAVEAYLGLLSNPSRGRAIAGGDFLYGSVSLHFELGPPAM